MMKTTTKLLGLIALLGWIATPRAAVAQTKLLRYPDLHGDRVVFTYAGDLWLAPATGGEATQLTTHPGLELFAKFSPDGRWIAFTGQYDGDEQVYVMPADGGVPRQLTFYPAPGPLPPRWGYDNQVYGWTADGAAVLFRSMRDGWDLSDTRLYTVALAGGLPVALPMPVSGAGALSPDGRRVVYSPLVRDFRSWKRYQGGWAQDLWIFDLQSLTATRMTEDPRSDRDPMWIGDTIYWVSDRDGKLNLYARDVATGDERQVTHETVWDLRWPSASEDGRIVFELAGELRVLDPARGTVAQLAIRVPSDGLAKRPARIAAADFIEDVGLAPKGQRALFTAHGDVFTAPIEHGAVRNLTRSSDAHDREAAWSPDGRWIAFVSDRSGEEEIWRIDALGREAMEQLTGSADGAGTTGRKYGPTWSPDGRRLAYADQAGRLFVLDIGSREVVEVADDILPFGLTWDWSPDGEYLALDLAEPNGFRSISIWSAAERSLRKVTSERFNESSPSWDPNGRFLYYLGDHEFRPQIGSYEFNYVVDRETLVYALALDGDVERPFPPRSDEVETAEPGAEGEKGGDAGGEGPVKVEIDFDGLSRRVVRVPMEAGNYFAVTALDGALLVSRGAAGYYGRAPGAPPEIVLFSIEDREETVLATGFDGYDLSPDRGHVLVSSGGAYQLYEASKSGKDSAKEVATAGLFVDRVPAREWAQIFDEAWRRFRDFFYVENMNGYDWSALRERYRPLLAHVGHRSDLSYVLSEMVAELNNSHTYVPNGDFVVPDRPRANLLGARFEADETSGRYRIAEILAGDNAEENYRSPLTEVGVDVSEGDYLLAIGGVPLTTAENPYDLLRRTGPGALELTVSGEPDLAGARRVLVEPIASEDDLLYLAFVDASRRRVEELGGGRLGYIHIPDMGVAGLREWIKGFYGQIRKEGLVIDVRSNGGGNVSQLLIERLRREVMGYDFGRNQDVPSTVPGVVFHGHLVCLLDEDTASDGDNFAWAFREAGLGPLVGKRSWGGVVGYYPGRGPLIDGGRLAIPEIGSTDRTGRWVVEGHGVDPDYDVDNDPGELVRGRDQQLEKAVELLLAAIGEEPKVMPPRPEDPVKTE